MAADPDNSPPLPSVSGSTAAPAAAAAKEIPRDLYCGHRCLKFILEKHANHPESELVTYINAVGFSRERGGISMQELGEAFVARGVPVQFITPSRDSILSCSVPVVAHLRASGDESGHFVVQLPNSSADQVEIVDGDRGHISISAGEFLSRVDGGYIVPLLGDVKLQHVRTSESVIVAILAWLLALECVIIAVVLRRKLPQRHQSPG